jgi:uncharacterized protein YecT (DUF1311 family)
MLIPSCLVRAGRKGGPRSHRVAVVSSLAAIMAIGSGVAWIGSAGAAGVTAPATFAPIREVWDGNRVARVRPAVAVCSHASTTLALVTCNEDLTENLDVKIDTVRRSQFAAAATNAARLALNADDAAWLADRATACAVSYPAEGGGTIGEIIVSALETKVSQARLDAVQSKPAPTAHLVATDDPDPHFTEYAVTGGGTLIGAIDTQGDETGGVIIAWVVIGGYKGFTVRPGAFTFVDGSFTDKGIVAGHPGGHHVAAGKEWAFDIDYSRLAKDPHEARGTGRFEYRSGSAVVGSWK